MEPDKTGTEPDRVLSLEEAEALLLERAGRAQRALEDAVWDLVVLYSRSRQADKARPYVEQLLAHADGPGRRAFYLLALGQILEELGDYTGALEVYTQALPLEPADGGTWYLINNNLGYCLNYLGRHAEAEAHCRRAIEIDPNRHNAYKNLGIALENQGKFAEAARNYRRAAELCPADRRAARHLEALLAVHPEAAGGLAGE